MEITHAPQPGPRINKWIIPALLILYLQLGWIGYLVFSSKGVMVGGLELSRDRAFFASVNALTLSGFQQSINPDQYLPLGQWLVMLLTVLGSLLAMIIPSLAVVEILRLPWNPWRVIVWAILVHLVAISVGGALLESPDANPISRWLLAASALGNSGLYLGELPPAYALRTHLVLLPLMVLGGLGLPVILELVRRFVQGNALTLHARTTLVMSAGVYLVCLFGMLGLRVLLAEDEKSLPGSAQVVSDSIWSINSRSAGFNLQSVRDLPAAMQWMLMGMMLIGGATGGSAGGLKVTSVAALGRGWWRALRGRPVGNAFAFALLWLAALSAICAVAMILLLNYAPQMPTDRLLFVVLSAAGNVGLSHDPITLRREAIFILGAVALLGKIVPMLLLWWMACFTDGDDLAVS